MPQQWPVTPIKDNYIFYFEKKKKNVFVVIREYLNKANKHMLELD